MQTAMCVQKHSTRTERHPVREQETACEGVGEPHLLLISSLHAIFHYLLRVKKAWWRSLWLEEFFLV